jgi:uncharacterized protein (TIGR02145 family)
MKNEVTIGNQVWMIENLNVDKFSNGDPIPEAKTKEEWVKAGENKQPAWCYYNNDSAYGEKCGKLYNWYAVIDSRGLAPVGYHIPTDEEWQKLVDYLGYDVGIKMKSTSGWAENERGTNESGFSALPCGCGYRGSFFGKKFFDIGNFGYWWSSTELTTLFSISALYRVLDWEGDVRRSKSYNKEEGFSIRCLKD